jgi:alpha-tubulin suppressor-like RCC1 family protein
VTAQGGVMCWGWNQFGQLGDGTTTNTPTPVDVFGLSSGVTALAASSTHTCALTAPGGIKCWGTNYAGELGDGTTNYSHTPVDVSGLTRGVVALAAGDQLTCAVTAQGGVKCWGGNAYGELGNGTTINSATPVFVSGLSSGMKALSAGGFHTCALTAQGGVMCWGENGSGQLGDGPNIEGNTPSEGTNIGKGSTEGPPIGISTPVVVSSLSTGATALAAGSAHTCALTAKGGVKCWGGNTDGELGNGTTINSATPVDVSGLSSGVKAITAGGNHTCVLTKQGGVKCWGSNGSGQLGNGTTSNSTTPVEVFGLSTGVKALAAGSTHTCALTAQGGVECWGDNESGQLGDGTNIENNTPVDVSGLSSGVTSLAAGENYTCAVTASGGVKCWGTDIHGRITGVTTFQSNTPMDVSGLTSGVKELAAGGMHTCALTVQGGVKCWGLNNDGQLGDGTNDDASKPVDVSRLTGGAKQLAAGGFHTCALTAQGGVKCWGDNEFGQLGIGILHYSTTPVDVVSGEEPSTSASGAAGKPICTPLPMALFPALAGLVFWRQRAKRRIHS